LYTSWRLIEWNEPSPTNDADDCPDDQAHADRLAVELADFISSQVKDLEQYLAEQFPPSEDHESALARAAALDDSAEGRALLRYEGQHGREFRATLNQLIKLTRTNEDVVEGDSEGTAGPESSPQVVSTEPVESPTSEAPSKATEVMSQAPSKATEDAPEAPEMPSKATEGGPDGRAKRVVRGRTGSRGVETPRLNQ
jgi:hypothetical protein